MKEESVRKFIKDEATKQFDGDYDILFATAKDQPIESLINARGKALTFKEAL